VHFAQLERDPRPAANVGIDDVKVPLARHDATLLKVIPGHPALGALLPDDV